MIVPNELINFVANLHKNVFVPVVWSIFRKRSSEKSVRLKTLAMCKYSSQGRCIELWHVHCFVRHRIWSGVGS